MRPTVSIIITVYNQADLIIRALDSVPRRDDIEVVVYDDCSTDGTFEAVKKYAAFHPQAHIRLYSTGENIGIGLTKNLLYETARGEYIHQLDSDDRLNTAVYEQVIDTMLTGEDIVYINLVTNSGEVYRLCEGNKRYYCAGIARFIKRDFIGDTRCPDVRKAEDWYFNEDLLRKNPTERFTDMNAYLYNYPRAGSLTDLAVKELRGK